MFTNAEKIAVLRKLYEKELRDAGPQARTVMVLDEYIKALHRQCVIDDDISDETYIE